MRKNRKLAGIAAFWMMATAARAADAVPGRWRRIETLSPGTAVIVYLAGGERFECAFNRIGPDEISFTVSGQERRLPRTAIVRVENATYARDRLRNGVLIGALAGAAGGIAGMAAYGNAKTNGPVHWGDEDAPGYLLAAALVGGGMGAAAGAAIDALIEHHEVLYRAR